MDKGQRKFLILIIIILVLTSIGAVYLSLKSNPNDDNSSINNPSLSKDIKRLNILNEFYGVQNSINLYITNVSGEKNDVVYNMLDEEYINENNLNVENVSKILNDYTYIPSFIAEEIYYNPNSNTTYYFVKGYIVEYPVEEGSPIYKDNVNYLLIVDINKHFVIRPLEGNIDIEEYAKNYEIKTRNFNNGNNFTLNNISEKNKLIGYINNFQTLLFLNPERAYNMLDEETKTKFMGEYEDYEHNKETFLGYRSFIVGNLFTEYEHIDKKNNVYSLLDGRMYKIVITENGVMDYKIGFDFGW